MIVRKLMQHLMGGMLTAQLLGPATIMAQVDQSTDLETLRTRALELVNDARQKHGLPSLEFADHIDKAARVHARDMMQRQYYSHASPDGETVQHRYIQAGGSKWRLTAENIARCERCTPPLTVDSVERLHTGWMESPDHRDNILKRGLTHFGFGIASDGTQGLYAVQTFAGPGSSPDIHERNGLTHGLSLQDQPTIAQTHINRARQSESKPVQLSSALTEAARSILPEAERLDQFSLQNGDGSLRLPISERRRWQSLSMLVGICGGCGSKPTAADIQNFVQQWLGKPQYAATLKSNEITHLGFAIVANGEGKKVALGILGRLR